MSVRLEQLLIEQVRQREFLYNPNLIDYRDHKMRQKAWEEIGQELKMTGECR